MSGIPVYRWRLTESGKRLWRLRTAFTLDELNEAEFIDMLAREPVEVPDGSVCLSCGHVSDFMVASFYCVACCRAAYQRQKYASLPALLPAGQLRRNR